VIAAASILPDAVQRGEAQERFLRLRSTEEAAMSAPAKMIESSTHWLPIIRTACLSALLVFSPAFAGAALAQDAKPAAAAIDKAKILTTPGVFGVRGPASVRAASGGRFGSRAARGARELSPSAPQDGT